MEIQNFPNYLIYEDGRVFSNRTNKFIKENIDRYGYRRVQLYNDGKQQTVKIHRLIAIHFIPNPENKREVDHINRNKLDNRICNLRWSTRVENNNNKGIMNTNKSGHKYIYYYKSVNMWVYHKNRKSKYFKTKIDAICYKFIMRCQRK
jgi:hypothetical protein